MLATLVQNISEHFASMTLKYDIWEVKKVAVQVSDNKIDSCFHDIKVWHMRGQEGCSSSEW